MMIEPLPILTEGSIIESFDIILSNLKSIDILHGTGTGALQEAIHKHLKKISFISCYKFAPMDQGGMGITIVEL